MAGTSADFDTNAFRLAIHSVMEMGMPAPDSERLTWHFKPVDTWAPQDPERKPYDWTTPPETETLGNPSQPTGQVTVDYALEFSPGSSTETDVGQFTTSSLKVTLLDTEFVKVKDADYATIGAVYYKILFVAPPEALFDAQVYVVYLQARDQA